MNKKFHNNFEPSFNDNMNKQIILNENKKISIVKTQINEHCYKQMIQKKKKRIKKFSFIIK